MNLNLKTLGRSALALLAATLLTSASAASIALAAGGALAASRTLTVNQVRSETVSFAATDADTSAGAQALYDRIHAAVLRVCSEPDPRSAQACAALAERRAIEQLNRPLLTAHYQKAQVVRR